MMSNDKSASSLKPEPERASAGVAYGNGHEKGPGVIIIVMGVSGSGKSSIAGQLAHDLDAHCKDGDELHSAASIEKMAQGIPLTDSDRQPWLESVAAYAAQQARRYGICVVACSALKRRYRETLNAAGHVLFVFLDGPRELIASRLHERTGHYMPATLLDSQFAALEDPRGEANVVTVSIDDDIQGVARQALFTLEAHPLWPAPARSADKQP